MPRAVHEGPGGTRRPVRRHPRDRKREERDAERAADRDAERDAERASEEPEEERAEQSAEQRTEEPTEEPTEEERGERARRSVIGAAQAAGTAADHVAMLTGRQPERVTAVERTEDGWRVGIEVLETHRIPDSTDILAVYRVIVDQDGELISYRREQRHYRGRAEEE